MSSSCRNVSGILLLVIGATLCISGCDKAPAPQELSEPLVWGGPKNISMLPIIADKNGYFKEEGLDVRPNYVQTGKIAMDAVVSGDLNFGVIVEVNIAFVKFQEGANIKVVTGIAEKYDDAIVARQDQGIRKPEDVHGKTLAMLPGTTSQRFGDLFIDFYKLDRAKISIINLSPPGIQASLINGQIPAGSVWQPFRYNVQQALGEKAIQFNDRSIYKCSCLLAVHGDYAKTNPAHIHAFLKALIKAQQFVENNKDEAIVILAKEIDIDPKVLSAVWDDYVLGVKLDLSLVQTFANTGEWIIQSQKGFEGKSVPSYQDVLSSEFLSEVDSKRIIMPGR